MLTNAPIPTDVDNEPISGGKGTASPPSAVQIGGSDGTNLQALATDTSGRQRAVGAVADGAAVAGDPVLSAGSDGTNTRTLATDTSGRQRAVGAGAAGAAVQGDPVRVGVSDGTNTQNALGDTAGRQRVVGAASAGTAETGDPVLVGGTDGTNVRTLKTDATGKLETVQTQQTAGTGTISSVAAATSNTLLLAANANRLGATIFNDGPRRLRIALGEAASSSNFSVVVPPRGYYEVPGNFTGIINGIWNATGGGAARVTELTT